MRKTIMLVDDDVDDIQLFKEALETVTKDFDLITANSGREALNIVLEEKIDLDHIFLDINMPVMTGVECLEELAKRKKLPPPFVTMYTTSGKATKDYARCVELGAAFLTKPNTYTDLIKVLRQQLISA